MVLLFVGIFMLASFSENSFSPVVSLSNTAPLKEWFTGNVDAPVALVEYSDYECPACAAYNPIVKQLLQDFPNQIKLSYRNFPLSQHKNAISSASAAEAAGNQGKFWEMHDLLLENQTTWSESSDAVSIFEGYASTLGLDMNKFKSDVQSKEVSDKIERDYQTGVESQIQSTPSFFINGKKMNPPKNYDEFKTNIANALATKS